MSAISPLSKHGLLIVPSKRPLSFATTSDTWGSSMSSESVRDLDEREFADNVLIPLGTQKVHTPSDICTRKKKKIWWGVVEVRMYPIIPGDHPDCVNGPPLSIAWDHVEEFTASIDEFENERSSCRLTGEALRLSWMVRRTMLKIVGFGESEIDKAIEASRKTRRYRQRTMTKLGNERFEQSKKYIVRNVTRLLRLGQKKQLITRN